VSIDSGDTLPCCISGVDGPHFGGVAHMACTPGFELVMLQSLSPPAILDKSLLHSGGSPRSGVGLAESGSGWCSNFASARQICNCVKHFYLLGPALLFVFNSQKRNSQDVIEDLH